MINLMRANVYTTPPLEHGFACGKYCNHLSTSSGNPLKSVVVFGSSLTVLYLLRWSYGKTINCFSSSPTASIKLARQLKTVSEQCPNPLARGSWELPRRQMEIDVIKHFFINVAFEWEWYQKIGIIKTHQFFLSSHAIQIESSASLPCGGSTPVLLPPVAITDPAWEGFSCIAVSPVDIISRCAVAI